MDHQTQTRQSAALVSPELRAQALAVLRGTLTGPPGWEKIHAAEALLILKDEAGVREAIERDLETAGGRPQYRIGLWRMQTLAENEPSRRQPWLDRIREALFDPQGPDRVHAAEALAKLGYQPRDANELLKLQKTAQAATDGVAVFLQWVLANAGRPEAIQALSGKMDSTDPVERLRAAYALSRQKGLPETIKNRLAVLADSEPEGSTARVWLLGCALYRIPQSVNAPRWKAALRQIALKGDKADQYPAALALAERGDGEELPILTQMLASEVLDVRVGAARAILSIRQRASAHPITVKE